MPWGITTIPELLPTAAPPPPSATPAVYIPTSRPRRR